jgi:Tfp pilus assembly protein PilE
MKKGVTLLIVVVAITVMLILITSASVIGSGAITSANYEEYRSKLSRVSNNVNEYYVENQKLPITNEIVASSSLGDNFVANMKENGDISEKLFVVDMSLLNDSTITNGIGTVANQDVYLVTENTQNIYYLKGFKYKSKVYFSY